MPIPLRPNGNGVDNGASFPSSGYLSINPSQLSDFINISPLITREAAGDKDAGILYSLWEKSTMTKGADRIKDRVYTLPGDFSQNEILRLKTSGFLVKADQGVSFTEKAEQVIQTMVLGEENSFHKDSVKKPYSMILAEAKSPKRSSNLTHTAAATARPEKQDVFRTSGLVSLAMSENVYTIPEGAHPTSDSLYVLDRRVVYTQGGSYKEYNVRVYDNGDGTWDVWAFNGKIDGTMAQQPKGRYHNVNSAIEQASDVINSKMSKGYKNALSEGFSANNSSLPGTSSGKTTKPATPKPVAKPNPVKPVSAKPSGSSALKNKMDLAQAERDKKKLDEQQAKAIADALEAQLEEEA